MKVCLVYFDGSEAPLAARQYLHSLDSIEIPMSTCWLVAHSQGAAHLYFDVQKHVSLTDRFVVVPLEQRLVPLHAQNRDFPLHNWLDKKRIELQS